MANAGAEVDSTISIAISSPLAKNTGCQIFWQHLF
jgi:hypothetical protein